MYFDLKHAVAEGSGGAFRVGALRQRDAAVEAAIAAFALVIAAVAAGPFLMALALDGHPVLIDFHLDILFLDARQISGNQQLPLPLDDVHVRRPQRGSSLRISGSELRALSKFRREEAAAEPEAVEQPVHFLRDPAHGRERPTSIAPIREKRRASAARRDRAVGGPLPAAPLRARLIILARTLLPGLSALLGRNPILRNFRALLLTLTTGLPACLTIFTHIDSSRNNI